jgi:hypothetical protein
MLVLPVSFRIKTNAIQTFKEKGAVWTVGDAIRAKLNGRS